MVVLQPYIPLIWRSCSSGCSVFQKIEPWEAEKTTADLEEYIWEDSPSQKNILDTLLRMKVAEEGEDAEVRQQLLGRQEVQDYKDSVVRLKNEGANESSMLQYKEAVQNVLKVWNLQKCK